MMEQHFNIQKHNEVRLNPNLSNLERHILSPLHKSKHFKLKLMHLAKQKVSKPRGIISPNTKYSKFTDIYGSEQQNM